MVLYNHDKKRPRNRKAENQAPVNQTLGNQKPEPLVAADHATDGKFHLLLAASGSVATIKIPNIIEGLASSDKIAIRVIFTESAAQFLQGQSEEQPSTSTISMYPNVEAVYMDKDEWELPWKRGAPILHIELRRWADLLVIAPLSANTLAKLSNGLCDNLLTSVVRAWDVQPTLLAKSSLKADYDISSSDIPPAYDEISDSDIPPQKQIIVAPAMNTAMWRHPITKSQLHRLVNPVPELPQSWVTVLWPIEKTLACGDTGDGAMTDWKIIVSTILERMRAHFQTLPQFLDTGFGL